MAINYTTTYQSRVDERFSKKSLSQAFCNKDYSWVGSEAIKVFSIPTVAMTDYTLSGTDRFGTPTELENEVQTMLLAKDRSFTFTIDSKSEMDNPNGVMAADKALRRQVDEVITPEIDTYTFGKMIDAAIANNAYAAAAITSQNAYSAFLTAQETLDDALVSETGRLMAATPAYINNLKLDPSFTLASDLMAGKLVNGQYGEVDGARVVKVPSARLGANTNFILAHPVATVMAKKLEMFRILDEVQGIDGKVVEGRVRYDTFVLDSKVDGLYVHLKAAPSL